MLDSKLVVNSAYQIEVDNLNRSRRHFCIKHGNQELVVYLLDKEHIPYLTLYQQVVKPTLILAYNETFNNTTTTLFLFF